MEGSVARSWARAAERRRRGGAGAGRSDDRGAGRRHTDGADQGGCVGQGLFDQPDRGGRRGHLSPAGIRGQRLCRGLCRGPRARRHQRGGLRQRREAGLFGHRHQLHRLLRLAPARQRHLRRRRHERR